MRRLWLPHLLAIASLLLQAQSGGAAPMDLTVIGIWSENAGVAAPGSGTGLAKGQKFVVKTTYDPASTPLTLTTVNGFTYYTVDLAGGAAPPSGGGLFPNGNSLDVLIPLEGFDGTSPFIYSSDEFSHGDFPGDPFPSPVPQVHFRDAGGTDLLGFKMESLSTGPGGNFVQMQTEVANIDPGDGIPVPTGTSVAQIRTGSFDMVIRSINAYVDAVPVQAEAGAPLAFSAADLSITTDGGTFRNPDGTWQDNDLGAGRTDKEDFLTHEWRLLGSAQGGAADVALVGADADAERPNIIPSESPFVLQPPPTPGDTRSVEKVNKTVAIADSGLRSTTDVATWQVGVSEDLTGFGGGTDTVEVSYANAAPTASAGPDLVYSFSNQSVTATGGVSDDDLAVNGAIPGFESHTFDWKQGGASLPGSPSGSPNLAVDITASGLTNTLDKTMFTLEVTDLAGAADSIALDVSYQNSETIIANALATPAGLAILFELDVEDADLAINALGLVDFELVEVELFLDGNPFSGLEWLIEQGSQLVFNYQAQDWFGVGDHVLEVRATDRVLRDGSSYVNAFIPFSVLVPEPGTGVLLGLGLTGLAALRRRGIGV